MKFLETPRLLVRHFVPEDAEALFKVHSNPKVAPWMGDGKPLTYERCVKWIETSLRNNQTHGFGASAVVMKSTNEFVGCCGLIYDPEGIGQKPQKLFIASSLIGGDKVWLVNLYLQYLTMG